MERNLDAVLQADGEAPEPLGAEPNDKRKFKELELLVTQDVEALGFSRTSVLQGWGDVSVDKVIDDSWALANGMKSGMIC